MTEKILENFSIAQICESGQCFRMEEMQDGRYRVIAGNRYLELEQQGKVVRFDCSEVEYQNFWRHYFDIETDYGAIAAQINPNDRYLTAAIQTAWGCKDPEPGFVGDDRYVSYIPAEQYCQNPPLH